jgi:uncharacterized DUF497 family protein
MELIFEWDKDKAKSNFLKHKVSFDEARTIFGDELAVTFRDDFHSDSENRYISIGMSINTRVLLVVHTEQDKTKNEVIIRIISSRKATASERKTYEKGR